MSTDGYSMDDLEHDSTDDEKAGLVDPPTEVAHNERWKIEDDITPRQEAKRALKESMGMDADKPWLHIDNPAIWDGEIDSDFNYY